MALPPTTVRKRSDFANDLVRQFMDEVFGKDKWKSERRPSKSGAGTTTWVDLK